MMCSPRFLLFCLLLLVAMLDLFAAEQQQPQQQQQQLSSTRRKRDLQSGALLSRYGRAAVLSRYGKRSSVPVAPDAVQQQSAGPWLLCQRTIDGQFLRCRPFKALT